MTSGMVCKADKWPDPQDAPIPCHGRARHVDLGRSLAEWLADRAQDLHLGRLIGSRAGWDLQGRHRLLDLLAVLLRDGLTRMPGGPAVDRRLADLLRAMGTRE